MSIGIFSFFSGAGFLDLGFETTEGYEVMFVNELHKPFLEAYQDSRKTMKIPEPQFGYSTDDVQTFLSGDGAKLLLENFNRAKAIHEAVGFIGGPPCPDFSIGGKNKGSHGENGKLSNTYADIICSVKPDFFLFENVKGLYRTVKHREFFEKLKEKFQKCGYSLHEKVVNSLHYGAPQERERIMLFGTRGGGFGQFNWDSHAVYTPEQIQDAKWPDQTPYIEDSATRIPRGVIRELTVQHWFKKNKVESHPNSKHCFKPRAGLAKFKVIPEGDDSKKSYKRLHRWRYSPTAAYGNNEVHLHPFKSRRISAAEALAIQSLPKEFVLPPTMSLTNMFKTIGNGVPYLLSKGIASQIKDCIEPD